MAKNQRRVKTCLMDAIQILIRVLQALANVMVYVTYGQMHQQWLDAITRMILWIHVKSRHACQVIN